MPSPFATLPLMGDNLSRYCKQLSELPPSAFWIHEKKLCEHLQLPKGPKHGPSEVLTTILACMREGGGGNRRKGSWKSTGFDGVDLSEEGNAFGIYYQECGRKEEFSRGYLVEEPRIRPARWFKIGHICNIEVREQLDIANELIGDAGVEGNDDDLDVLPAYIARRRKESYAQFYRGERAANYRSWDLPYIAYRFLDLWKGVKLNDFWQGESEMVHRRSSV